MAIYIEFSGDGDQPIELGSFCWRGIQKSSAHQNGTSILSLDETCLQMDADADSLPCSECDGLWRRLGEVAQRTFQLEQQLYRAQRKQNQNLVEPLSTKLMDLAREQLQAQRLLAQHQMQAHAIKKKVALVAHSGS